MEVIPDRAGVVAGYRVWRVIPDRWISPTESLYPHSCDWLWSSTGPTTAHCHPRLQWRSGTTVVGASCDEAPGYECACGLHARYEPAEEVLLPYVAGSVLAWGRVVHHAESSYFRAEKALPVAFVRPRGGTGLFTGEAEEKLLHIGELLGAEILENPEELRSHTEGEASRW
jgi:hypothetical protein